MRRTILVVVALHLLALLGLMLVNTGPSKHKHAPAPLVVRTVHPPARTLIATPSTLPVKALPKATPPPSQAKPVVARPAVPKPRPVVQKRAKVASKKALRAKAQAEIQAIALPKQPTPSTSPPAQEPEELPPSPPPPGYATEVAKRLQSILQLPEHGSVRVALEVSAAGAVIGLEILEAHSERNEKYVRSILPSVSLPALSASTRKSETLYLTLESQL